MNSQPFDSSVKLILEGKYEFTKPISELSDAEYVRVQEAYDKHKQIGGLVATHRLLKSAYCDAGATADTIYTLRFTGAIDYIFYSGV